ncbi:zinc finger protein 90-like, partial [Asbolus verrucosus]
MRHIRITGQNIKNLAVFKNQIGGILKELNKFDEKDKNEAMSYLRSCVNGDTNPSSSSLGTSSESPKATRRKKRKATENVSSYTTLLRKRSYSSATKNIKHNRNKKVKYTNSSSVPLTKTIFKCKSCNAVEKTKRNMLKHVETHVGAPLSCIKCKRTFNGSIPFKWHLNHYCNPRFYANWKFKCNQCPRRHNRYKCVTCDESYASRAKVTRHKQQGHQVEGLNPRFICPHCPIAFHRENRFHIHMRKHTEENRSVNCKYCKKTFNSPYAYYKHCITINHEKFSPEISDIVCDKCGKHFAKRYDLRQHMYRVHNVSKQLVACQYCDYKTVHKCNMDRHVALHLRKNSQFTCEYCGKSCDSIASLKDHITYNHIQEKQFKCDKCDKSFKRNSELVRHQDSHSDERPHVCTLCGKTYKRLNHLKRHEKRAHEIVKETRRIKKITTEPEVPIAETATVEE